MKDLWLNEGNIGGIFTASVPGGLAINMGLTSGMSTVDKFGVNLSVTDTSEPEDVWEFGGDYTYDTWGTAPIQYISSSSAADADILIYIEGLDINGDFVQQLKTIQGQTNLTLDTPLWRVYRAANLSDTGNDINGIVYIHTDASPTLGVPLDANVRAIINGANNQTLMSVYTIPRGKVGFLFRGEMGVQYTAGNAASNTAYAHCHYESRLFGKCFRVKKAITLMAGGNSIFQDARSFPDVIPALTDVKLRVQDVSETMGVWGTLDLLIVDEALLPEERLKNIGQPGYYEEFI